jgi:hypothetical protein
MRGGAVQFGSKFSQMRHHDPRPETPMVTFHLIGLIFNALGLLILMRAFALEPVRDISVQPDGQADLLSACQRRLDLRFGLGIMLAGFFIQILGQMFAAPAGSLKLALLSGLAAAGLVYVFKREEFAERDARMARNETARQVPQTRIRQVA